MRLLSIEDEIRIADLLKVALERAGFAVDSVRFVGDAGEALVCIAYDAAYDAAILDLGLPDGDGIKLLGELRAAGNPTSILVLTARDTVEDRVIGLDAGADDYLIKPSPWRSSSPAPRRCYADRAAPWGRL